MIADPKQPAVPSGTTPPPQGQKIWECPSCTRRYFTEQPPAQCPFCLRPVQG